MNFKRNFLVVLAALLLSASAFAWNCSDPLASRVDVGPVNPGGSSGDGDGQWFLGTGSEGIKGDYYVCQVPKKSNPTPPSTTNTNTNTNTQGQQQGQGQTQGQTANGGSSGVSNSGNSSSTATGGAGGSGGNSTVKNTNNVNTTVVPVIKSTNKLSNSGNSSNTNTNTANGGSANGNGSNNTTSASSNQTQSNSSTNANQSSANGNGAGAGANSNNTTNNIAAPKIPVPTAYAPTTIPTSPCLKGYEAGGQGAAFGFALGGSKVDKNCQELELARSFDSMNERLAGCKVKVDAARKIAKDAGVTVADCMEHEMVDAPPVVLPPAPPTPQQPTFILIPQQAPVAAPAVVTPAPVIQSEIPVGICTFASKTQCTAKDSDAVIIDPSRPTAVCKEMIAAATAQLKLHPGYVIVLRGNRNPSEDVLLAATRANRVKQQFEASGVSSGHLKTEVGTGDTRTVSITLVPQS